MSWPLKGTNEGFHSSLEVGVSARLLECFLKAWVGWREAPGWRPPLTLLLSFPCSSMFIRGGCSRKPCLDPYSFMLAAPGSARVQSTGLDLKFPATASATHGHLACGLQSGQPGSPLLCGDGTSRWTRTQSRTDAGVPGPAGTH